MCLVPKHLIKPAVKPHISFILACLSILVLAGATGDAFAHADKGKIRYVAPEGKDLGDCTDPFAPCQSIAFAITGASKGDEIRVASGDYSIKTAEEVFLLTSELVPVYGGYNAKHFFLHQDPKKYTSTLIGVPYLFRSQLEERGFSVIADSKSLGRAEQLKLDKLNKGYQAMQSRASATNCNAGFAGSFPCDQINLLSHVPLNAMSSNPAFASDIWGFVDLNDHREYAIVGLEDGTSVFDVTDEENATQVGHISGLNSDWRDIKVYQSYDSSKQRWLAYAYVTTDRNGSNLDVIDLSSLPNSISLDKRIGIDKGHNIYISNVDFSSGISRPGSTPFIYLSGTSTANGAYRIFDLVDPSTPSFVTQQINPNSNDYMHDNTTGIFTEASAISSCVNATSFCDVLFDFNESDIRLWDTTDKNDIELLSQFDYSNKDYTHSGWLTEDQQYLLVHDEQDEIRFSLNTTIRVFDISDLSSPSLAETWTGPSAAIDHNGFAKGNRYYISNYTRGLSVLDLTDPTNLSEIGIFDTYTPNNGNNFNGAWGVYPFLPSGNILISDINSGLFVLEDDTLASTNGQLGFTTNSITENQNQTVSISVQRQNGSNGAVSVDFEILPGSGGTADFTTSYTNNKGTLNWTDTDSANKNINIDINNAIINDFKKTFYIRLLNPQGGATLARNFFELNITKPGIPEQIYFLSGDTTIQENQGFVNLEIIRTGAGDGETVLTLASTNITAFESADFSLESNTLSWQDGEIGRKNFRVNITNDSAIEANETFSISLQSATGSSSLAAPNAITLTIENDDTESSQNSDPPAEDPEPETVDEETGEPIEEEIPTEPEEPDNIVVDEETPIASNTSDSEDDFLGSFNAFFLIYFALISYRRKSIINSQV